MVVDKWSPYTEGKEQESEKISMYVDHEESLNEYVF